MQKFAPVNDAVIALVDLLHGVVDLLFCRRKAKHSEGLAHFRPVAAMK